MDSPADQFFSFACEALAVEAERVAGFPASTRIGRYAGVCGLSGRSEAHLTFVIARALAAHGRTVLINEPYPAKSPVLKNKRFDIRLVIDRTDNPMFARYLTIEVKKYTILDSVFSGLLRDIEKIKSILDDEHGILNTPVGFLLIGFLHKPRDQWLNRRLGSFVTRAGLSTWTHLQHDIAIAPEQEPMCICALDFWCFQGEPTG